MFFVFQLFLGKTTSQSTNFGKGFQPPTREVLWYYLFGGILGCCLRDLHGFALEKSSLGFMRIYPTRPKLRRSCKPTGKPSFDRFMDLQKEVEKTRVEEIGLGG